MNYKRYLVEFDSGADLHGMDVTKAAIKACKGAVSHCCMSGMVDIFDLSSPLQTVKLDVKLAAPYPDKVDVERVRQALPPYNNVNIEVVQGGMAVKGLHVEAFGEGDNIVIVNAAITVYVDMDAVKIK